VAYWSGWRVGIRVAWREARRAKGRSALVTAMIAVPVAMLALAAVNADSFRLTPQERADRIMGAADAAVMWPYHNAVEQSPTDFDVVITEQPEPATDASLDKLLALLPPGTRAITDLRGGLAVRTVAGTGTLNARMLDYQDQLAAGILRSRSGRAPAAVDEVALTPGAVQRLGVALGGTVTPADGGAPLRVVGLVEDPTDLSNATIVLYPGARTADERWGAVWLIDTPDPVTWDQVRRLNQRGVLAVSRAVLADPPPADDRFVPPSDATVLSPTLTGFIAGLALLEIILLAGPAFAVGARRRRRDLGLVAASGGTVAHVRRIVLADGVVLGACGALVGLAVGIGAAAFARPFLEEQLVHARAGAFRVFPQALALLVGLAVLTGVLAALVPAWISARQDVVAALAGRRGITRSRRRWVALGLGLFAVGGVVAGVGASRAAMTIILSGLIVGELGLVLCMPALVGLVSRLGRWLPLGPRIALRDSSRNRTAAAPAVSAVMAAVIGSLAVGVMLLADTQRNSNDYHSANRPGDVVIQRSPKLGLSPAEEAKAAADAVAALRAIMPVQQVYEAGLPACGEGADCFVNPEGVPGQDCPYDIGVLRRDPTPQEQKAARGDARCEGAGILYRYFDSTYTYGVTLIVGDTAVGALTNLPPEDAAAAAAALRAGKVFVDSPRYLDGDQVTLRINAVDVRQGKNESIRTVRAPAFAPAHRPQAPLTLMTPATAQSLGVGSKSSFTVATTSRMPTVAEQDRVQAAMGGQGGVYVERGPQPGDNQPALIGLAVVAGVIAIGAAAIATALAAADGRADLGTLAAVGASPRVRRSLVLSQAGVIAGLGSVIGAVAGLGAAVAVLVAVNRGYADVWPAPTPYPIVVPWFNVAVAVVVVPVVAMLGAALLTRSRLPIERR
jgi:putative ABC transport system permease protein